MGLFRGKGTTPDSGPPVQPPDELAARARLEYGHARFAAAAELYSEAVDKLHTMYVMGQCTYRQPSSSDKLITDGLTSAVGAALAENSSVAVRGLIERSSGYLNEILQLPQTQPMSSMYESAAVELTRLYKAATH